MDKALIRTLPLDNGLELKLFDCSRKISGDRWQVRLVAEINIEIDPEILNGMAESDIIDIQNGLGKSITFEQKRDRIFIEDKSKDQVLGQVVDTFLDSTLGYLSHPRFPRGFIMKKYREYTEQRKWRVPGEG